MNDLKMTPMLRQYLDVKQQYSDAILLYRMGDFYEMFFEDAHRASKILEITLTSRNKKDETPIPMCGVPVRAVQGYMARLLEHGCKVAICEQTEDAALAKGLVKREVVRVITPGMIIENEFLDEKSDNFLLAVSRNHQTTGISCLDISTGTFRVSESDNLSAILDEIMRIAPAEILMPASLRTDSEFESVRDVFSTKKTITFLEDRYFDYQRGRERLSEQFKTLTLEGFGCESLKAGVSAAGAILLYVQENQKQPLSHFTGIETYSLDNYLLVDDISCRNLELMENLRTKSKQGTLLETIDRTVTAMGGRLFKRWLRYPLKDRAQIQVRLDAVEEARFRMSAVREIRELLKSVHDLERLGSRISMGHANARDLIALKRSLTRLPAIQSAMSLFQSSLFQWNWPIEPLNALAALIERAIAEDAPLSVQEGGMIRRGYHKELDELIELSTDSKHQIARLEAAEKKATGLSSLKIRYNKVFGYYIELSKTQAASAPIHYVRKQTLVNAERFITDELKQFEIKVLGAEERRCALEFELFDEVRKQVVSHTAEIQDAARFLSRLDCLTALAELAEQQNYCKPKISTDGRLFIDEGRHPVIETMISGERFVPNTIRMDNDEQQILIITGPNMAGKSTVLRQVALTALMAQMGSFVPARSALIPITDRIFTRVGALDNLSQGQSTFMVEMQETANILNNATPESLVIMDEIGRGTSTFDGLSIAWAVAEYLHDFKGKGVKTLFATHYHELTELALTKPRVKNYNIAVKEFNDEIIFLRKLVEGSTNRSYGIQVARLAGIPDVVIRRAKTILSDIEHKDHLPSLKPSFGGKPKTVPAAEAVREAPEAVSVKQRFQQKLF